MAAASGLGLHGERSPSVQSLAPGLSSPAVRCSGKWVGPEGGGGQDCRRQPGLVSGILDGAMGTSSRRPHSRKGGAT